MTLKDKAALAFVKGLGRDELVLMVYAYATGTPFADAYSELLPDGKRDNIPAYLAKTVNVFRKPRTIRQAAKLLGVAHNTVWTYLSKLRRLGIRVVTSFKYGRTVYTVETGGE